MHFKNLAAVALMAALGVATAAQARLQDASPSWSPETVADRVEQSAETSNFAQLEVFGRDALRRPGRDGLDRLYHVAWLFLNQSEFQRFDTWNGYLKARAKQEGDDRYVAVAEINDLRSRLDRGDLAAGEEIKRRANTETDWFARAHAQSTAAYVMVIQDQVGDALQLLYEADSEVPKGEPGAGMARAGIWESEGLGANYHDEEIPADMLAKCEAARHYLIENAVEMDDESGVSHVAQLA